MKHTQDRLPPQNAIVMPPASVREEHYKMSAGVCPFVRRASICLSVCPGPQHNSGTERPRKPKIDRTEVRHTGNPSTYLEVKGQRSRSSGRLMFT